MGKKKYTDESFKEKIFELVGNDYEVKGKYIDTNHEILIKHTKCDHEWKIKPYHFINGTRCPKCAGNAKKTTEIFKQEVYDKFGDLFSVLGEYKNANTKILMKHNVCLNEWEVTPTSFLKSSKESCPDCAKNKKRTHNQFVKEVFNLVGDEYEVVGQYINVDTPIDLIHKKCNKIWSVSPYSFLKGTRCLHCSGVKKKTTEEFKREVYELVGNEYLFLGEYINNNTHMVCDHNIEDCGFKWDITPSNFLTGGRCPKCQGFYRTTEEFKKMVCDLVKDEYIVLGEYINTNTPILMKHIICNNEWEPNPSYFLHGNRCPNCFGVRVIRPVDFNEEVYNLTQDEYLVLGEYKNSSTPIKMKHNIESCGCEWDVYPFNFTRENGSRCPSCAHKGENNYNWQGGITNLNNYFRSVIENWKQNMLIKYNYKCAITGKIGSQKVHHLYSFNLIVKEVLDKLNYPVYKEINNYSDIELNNLKNCFLEQHTMELGIVICNPIHVLFHKIYGNKSNTFEQFEEFKSRLKEGEFNSYLEKHNLKLII